MVSMYGFHGFHVILSYSTEITVSYVDYDLVVTTNFNKFYSSSSSCLIYFLPPYVNETD